MNTIQSKNHKIGTYEINKISLSCFEDKMYIQNNGFILKQRQIVLIFSLVRTAFLSSIFLLIFSLVGLTFLPSILNCEKRKVLKKELNEELMLVVYK